MIEVKCGKCGLRYAPAIGHACVDNRLDNRVDNKSHAKATKAKPAPAMTSAAPDGVASRPSRGGGASATYRYRDPEKRRAYMREQMRKRRQSKTKEAKST